MRKKKNRWNGQPIASFLGYQEDIDGDPIPLFNITGKHRRSGSTVDGNAIIREGIAFPVIVAPRKKTKTKKIKKSHQK